LAIVNARSGPNCASIGSAHEALVGGEAQLVQKLIALAEQYGDLLPDTPGTDTARQ
jgi:hypothetical protein